MTQQAKLGNKSGEATRWVGVIVAGHKFGTDYTAIVEGTRKLILSGDRKSTELGPTAFAYDLTADPEELKPMDPSAGWPAALDQKLRPVLEHLSRTQSAAEAATVDSAHADELRAMGYAGDY